jgi:Fe-S-cluster containining protein
MIRNRYGAGMDLRASENVDCLACGACCREAYHVVEVEPDDPFVLAHPDVLVLEDGRWTLPRPGGRCVCLKSHQEGLYVCDRYAERPNTCRDFEVGGDNCKEARVRVGLPPLAVSGEAQN